MNYASPEPKSRLTPPAPDTSALGRADLPLPVPHFGAPILRRCACGGAESNGGECEDCKKKKLRRSANGAATTSHAPNVVHQVLNSPGEPLSRSTRAFFEPRFGFDFSRIRVHADPAAAHSARSVNANAYAVGNHLVFGAGRYAPHAPEGRHLLAHELAHTVQQSGTTTTPSPGTLRIGDPDDGMEHQAQTYARRVTGASFVPSHAPTRSIPRGPVPLAVQRDPSKYSKLSIEDLQKILKTDPEAVEALRLRYRDLPYGKLKEYAKTDPLALSVYESKTITAPQAKGQGNFSKPGIAETLHKDLDQQRAASGIERKSPGVLTPEVQKTEGGTMGSARTDVPGLEGRVFSGASARAGGGPQPGSKFPPATSPDLPHTFGHAEENIANAIDAELSQIPREQLKGRTVWMLIEQTPCSSCAQGANKPGVAPGVIKKLANKYPELTFEVKSLENSGVIIIKGQPAGSAPAPPPVEAGGDVTPGAKAADPGAATNPATKAADGELGGGVKPKLPGGGAKLPEGGGVKIPDVAEGELGPKSGAGLAATEGEASVAARAMRGAGGFAIGLATLAGIVIWELVVEPRIAAERKKLQAIVNDLETKRQKEVQEKINKTFDQSKANQISRVLKSCWLGTLRRMEKEGKKAFVRVDLRILFTDERILDHSSTPTSAYDIEFRSIDLAGVHIRESIEPNAVSTLQESEDKTFATHSKMFEQLVSFSFPAPKSTDIGTDKDQDMNFALCGVDQNCFIATACFGSPRGEELDILRAFRDQVLDRFAPGRAFVRFYYRHSPPIAFHLWTHPRERAFVRECLLVPAIVILRRNFERT